MDNENTAQSLLKKRLVELEELFGITIDTALQELEKSKQKIRLNLKLYYNERKDQKDKQRYYQNVLHVNAKQQLYSKYHELVKRTHKQQLPYFMSKDQYLYTWVDLQPDGSLKNIYSGIHQDPKKLIVEDFDIIQKKHAEFQRLLTSHHVNNGNKTLKIPKIDLVLKFNTEHIVPLSWYSA